MANERCGNEFTLRHGYFCELPKGHEGAHGATCPNPQYWQSWSDAAGHDQPEPAPAPEMFCRNPNHARTDGTPEPHEIGPSCMAEPAKCPKCKVDMQTNPATVYCPICDKIAQPAPDEVTVRCRNDAPAAWDIAYPWVEDGAQACKLAREIELYARSRTAALEKQLAEAERENRELRAKYAAILERERTLVAEGVTAIKEAVQGREWLTEGRGPYEWNDDNWHKEFAAAAQEILAAIEPLVKVAADWSNCPQTSEEVNAARAALSGIATEQKEGE